MYVCKPLPKRYLANLHRKSSLPTGDDPNLGLTWKWTSNPRDKMDLEWFASGSWTMLPVNFGPPAPLVSPVFCPGALGSTVFTVSTGSTWIWIFASPWRGSLPSASPSSSLMGTMASHRHRIRSKQTRLENHPFQLSISSISTIRNF